MAVREWARISHPVARIVQEVDDQREELLADVFEGIGYMRREAVIRARVFYWHQVEIGRHTSELQSLMRISSAVFCLKKKKNQKQKQQVIQQSSSNRQ